MITMQIWGKELRQEKWIVVGVAIFGVKWEIGEVNFSEGFSLQWFYLLMDWNCKFLLWILF